MSRSRLRVSLAAFVLSSALTACGGGGGGAGAGVIPAQPRSLTQQVVSFSGAISTIQSATAFLLHTVDGQDVDVTLSSSTVVDGPAPYQGETVDVAGTAQSTPPSVLATSVKQSSGPISVPSGTVAVTGTEVGPVQNGLTLRTDAGNTITVSTDNSTTYANGRPSAGSYLEVSGPGTATTGIAAKLIALFPSAPPAVTLTGTVKQQTAYGIQITLSSGPPIDVAVVTATALVGSPAVGAQVSVSGNGSASAAVFAASVAGSAPPSTPSPVPTGTSSPTAAPTTAAPATPTPVPTLAPTPTPAPTITPTPTPVPTLAPTPVPAPVPTPVPTVAPTPSAPMTIAMQHVQTATYLWSSTEVATNPSIYAPYLTWAYAKLGTMLSTYEAGIKTIQYINPVMPQFTEHEGQDLGGAYSGARAVDCSGNPITVYKNTGWLSDPRSASAGAYYSDVINWYVNNALLNYSGGVHDWDAMFIDNSGPLYNTDATPCNYSTSTWGPAFDNIIGGLGQNFVINALGTGASSTQTYVNYMSAPTVIGGEYERCFSDGQWSAEENSQLQTLALIRSQGKAPGPGWWCYLDNTSADSTTVIPQRLFAYASFLLTYDPQYSLFQESYTTAPSTFQVFPETGFVPMNPSVQPSTIAGLQSGTGAYVQDYGACYYRGALVGSCEIAVNPGSGTVSVPNSHGFAHSMAISGGGVLDGGAVTFNASAPTSLAPNTAAILVP